MKTNIIQVKYEDDMCPRTFNGKSYSYYTNIDVSIGDLVETPTRHGNKVAKVVKTNVSPEEIENIKPYMKFITKKINKERYINFYEILEDIA